MKRVFQSIAIVAFLTSSISSCHDDLDQYPQDEKSFTEDQVFANKTEAFKALTKLYAALALTGQRGPDAGDTGAADVSGDEGMSQFSRQTFDLNESSTDNAIVKTGWGNAGLQDLHTMTWTTDNSYIQQSYARLSQVVTFSNSFLENSVKLTDSEVVKYQAEARFLRAYAYYNLLDLYGNVPIVTKVTNELPTNNTRKEVYEFVEKELLEVADLLPATNDYGRATKYAAYAMLSRLYLNAEVYSGTASYDKAMTYAAKVIDESGKSINITSTAKYDAYAHLFLADNNSNGAQNEFIWTFNFDGLKSQTWGGPSFMINATTDGSMVSLVGLQGAWSGYRVTPEFVNQFKASVTGVSGGGDPNAWSDKRANFYTTGHTFNITSNSQFSEGYALVKYRNFTSTGQAGNDSSKGFADCDIPAIRLAEMYLNYAEAAARTGTNTATAVTYINKIRSRAGISTIVAADLTKENVLAERARELYWEGFRRTDLIRYGLFTTGTYVWQWKGGVQTGKAVDSYRNLYPIPKKYTDANPNLKQNPGY